MGKTPKKAAPGGDESNLYVRRLKATTTTAPSKACDASLAATQRESDNSNRRKAIAPQKRLPVPTGKVFKSKLRSPSTKKSYKPLKNPPRFQPTTSKNEKITTIDIPTTSLTKDRKIHENPTMLSESEESAVQLKVSITKKDVKDGVTITIDDDDDDNENNRQTNDNLTAKPTTDSPTPTHANTNGKQLIDLTETENSKTVDPKDHADNSENMVEENAIAATLKPQTSVEKIGVVNLPCDNAANANSSTNTTMNNDSTKNDDSESEHVSSEFEDNALKLDEETELSTDPSELKIMINGQNENNEKTNETMIIMETVKNVETTESSESCSVDVVESTTSEPPDSGNASQSDKDQRDNEQPKIDGEIDASFVSYDSSIMLKDVQIKLNDCLKDNSNLFDVSNANDETNDTSHMDDDKKQRLDMSFGKTLRNISGRSTINRLRYVTVREQNRFSPNSSLFVNTSSLSFDNDDSTASCKILRQSNNFTDSMSFNDTPIDRKRKIVDDDVGKVKKFKTIASPERPSLLNASLDIIKNIRKPVQVSTPNTKGYSFANDKYPSKNFDDEKLLTVVNEDEPKKWCVVM